MKKIVAIILSMLLLLFSLSACTKKSSLDPDNPVTLTMWHVYGSQTDSPLNDCINEFNRTVGEEKGIVVNVVSVTDSSAIDEALLAAVEKTPGAPDLPDLFTAYPRMAEVIGYDNLLNWDDYFSEEELSAFVDDFMTDAYFEGKLLMLPVAKSSELFFLNQTLFDKFVTEADISNTSLSTFEEIFALSEKYYDYSNGKDLFQINDFYNYALTGMAAFGEDFISDGKLNLDNEAFEKIWTPMAHAGIHGGLCLSDGYASDRWKTGEILCNIGSTAGILYLRDYVTYSDNSTEDITTTIKAYPHFENASSKVVHRGSGLFAKKNEDEAKNEAAAVFAKWLTDKDNNLSFVTKAGYLPVTDDAFDSLFENINSVENEKYQMLYTAVKDMSDDYSYCELPLYKDASNTQSSFEKNVKSILNNAHTEYINRIDKGEASDTVLSELIADTLKEIRSIYK